MEGIDVGMTVIMAIIYHVVMIPVDILATFILSLVLVKVRNFKMRLIISAVPALILNIVIWFLVIWGGFIPPLNMLVTFTFLEIWYVSVYLLICYSIGALKDQKIGERG